MKYFVVVVISFILCGVDVCAQSNKDFKEMKEEGMRLFFQGKYSSALKMFDGAEGFAYTSKEKNELAQLKSQLRDTVSVVYNTSIKLSRVAKEVIDYRKALQSFKRLIPHEGLYVPSIFSWMGYCYEGLAEPVAALEFYEKGLTHNESYSAYRLAKLLPKYSSVSEDSIIVLLQIGAKAVKSAYDDIGDKYLKKNYNTAFEYYRKSGSNYGKYQMASLLLTKNIKAVENPIDLLNELSNVNYADAQFYLGLLYFHGNNRLNMDQTKGLNLINQSAKNGCKSASEWLEEHKNKPKITESEKHSKEHHSSTTSHDKYHGNWDVDNKTLGVSYSYYSAFPVAISVSHTHGYFYIADEFGINFEKKKYTLRKTSNSIKVGNPKFFISVNPGVYVKYLSFSCGIGIIFNSIEESKNFSSPNEEEFDSPESSVSGTYTTSSTTNVSLFIKPGLTGYIPLNDDLSLTLNVGYNICPKFKDLNSFSLGAGIQISIY